MKIFLETTNENKEMDYEGVIEKLLLKLKLNPEEVIVVKNGELTTVEDEVNNNDELKVLSVVSGG